MIFHTIYWNKEEYEEAKAFSEAMGRDIKEGRRSGKFDIVWDEDKLRKNIQTVGKIVERPVDGTGK